jgi:hypothetical protein
MAISHLEIYQRDDGLWQIGVDDGGPGPFESREFAMSVAGYVPPAPTIPFRKIIFKRRRVVVRDPPEKQNPRRDDRHHLARVEQNIEALNSFDHSKNLQLVYDKLQRRFGLSPATACTIAELALFAGCSR